MCIRDSGNSVRGKAVTRYLSEALGLNLFASVPAAPSGGGDEGLRQEGA
jgi:hypothetical protein